MLSYDSPVSMSGQNPASAASLSMSAGRQSIPTSPKALRLPTPGLSNGVHMNGVTSSNNATLAAARRPVKDHHIWLVTGPAGCGKSTIARYLSDALNLPYIEGDEVCVVFLRFVLV